MLDKRAAPLIFTPEEEAINVTTVESGFIVFVPIEANI